MNNLIYDIKECHPYPRIYGIKDEIPLEGKSE
jgi:hypothetical protein